MSTTSTRKLALTPGLDGNFQSRIVPGHRSNASEAVRSGLRPSTERDEAVSRARLTDPEAKPVR